MKLKINKACDLSSISVLPPHARRSSAAAFGPQASQHRSQPSQQSFSQGLSSQHGMFSQLSQSSLDEVLTNDQRVTSQERENTAKKFSCIPPASYPREDSQTPIRSSTNAVCKWNPASALDRRCQVSEDLERRIGMMETSLNRFGINMDSVQSDIMQVSRGSKEILLAVESICQKLVVQDTSLQLMNKGQEVIKAGLDGGLKSLSDQLGKDMYEDKFKEILLELSSLPGKMEASLLKLQNELSSFLTEEMKAMACNLKSPVQNIEPTTVFSQKAVASSVKSPNQESHQATDPTKKRRSGHVTSAPSKKPRGRPVSSQRKLRPSETLAMPPDCNVPAVQVTNVDMGGWKSVKNEQAALRKGVASMEHKQKGFSSVGKLGSSKVIDVVIRSCIGKRFLMLDCESLSFTVSEHLFFMAHLGSKSVMQAKECRIIIDSDEEIDGVFSCLINEKETDTDVRCSNLADNENKLIDDVKEETERILKKARKRKRKHDNSTIIIN